MKRAFVKMHGLGNDYLFLDARRDMPEDPPALARMLSRRRFSVGADGIVLICSSDRADVGMRIFNADGSEGETCGNALRCVGKLLYERGELTKPSLTVETRAGVHALSLILDAYGAVSTVVVQMGAVTLSAQTVTIDGEKLSLILANVGNPHAVLFVPDALCVDVARIGPQIESHPLFPQRTNVDFFSFRDPEHLLLRVWERGSGETLACGSGAAATAAVAVWLGLCEAERRIFVSLPGGTLAVTVGEDRSVSICGDATFVYEGVVEDGNSGTAQ